MFYPHTYCQLSGILRFIAPDTHGDTYYLVSLLLQHQASGGTVYSPAHADKNTFIGFFHIHSLFTKNANVRDSRQNTINWTS